MVEFCAKSGETADLSRPFDRVEKASPGPRAFRTCAPCFSPSLDPTVYSYCVASRDWRLDQSLPFSDTSSPTNPKYRTSDIIDPSCGPLAQVVQLCYCATNWASSCHAGGMQAAMQAAMEGPVGEGKSLQGLQPFLDPDSGDDNNSGDDKSDGDGDGDDGREFSTRGLKRKRPISVS